jgi:hypothetical protein
MKETKMGKRIQKTREEEAERYAPGIFSQILTVACAFWIVAGIISFVGIMAVGATMGGVVSGFVGGVIGLLVCLLLAAYVQGVRELIDYLGRTAHHTELLYRKNKEMYKEIWEVSAILPDIRKDVKELLLSRQLRDLEDDEDDEEEEESSIPCPTCGNAISLGLLNQEGQCVCEGCGTGFTTN